MYRVGTGVGALDGVGIDEPLLEVFSQWSRWGLRWALGLGLV